MKGKDFWNTGLGALTGAPDDAFMKSFEVVPDGTLAIAQIKSCKWDKDFKCNEVIRLQWEIGKPAEFKSVFVTQNIKVYDQKDTVRHTALNMLVLLSKIFNVQLPSDSEPMDNHLQQFTDKIGGIKVAEYYKPKDDGQLLHGNYVVEVHPLAGFVPALGTPKKAPEPAPINQMNSASYHGVESAFSRNQPPAEAFVDSDLPF